MNDLLFAVPWWIPTLLALVGVALFYNGNKTQVAKIRNAGIGLIALAIVWSLVSYFVDTDKEKVEKATRQFVQAAVDGTATGDWAKFKAKLTPAVVFKLGSGKSSGDEKVTAAARTGCELVKLKSAQLREITLEETGNYITVHCEIFTTEEFAAPIETSSWDFDWVKTNEGWKIQNIRLLKIKDIPAEQLDSLSVRSMMK
ncbi:MAG TPA: hypothetical protein VFE47_30790 [Tepidisphaeraceae bacterium]|jgi:hypothetical protein|nr:hypothetical protein [Tepidisphaeraceae bacterium]